MFDSQVYVARRKGLTERVEHGVALFPGNGEVGMNYAANPYHFRQDSSFLYYFGIDRPGLVALVDLDAGESWLFGDDPSIEDIVWTGPQPSVAELAARSGIEHSAPLADLASFLEKARAASRKIHFLPPYRAETVIDLHRWLGLPLDEVPSHASTELIRAVVDQRAHKGPEEVAEMERALAITGEMHLAVMRAARPGMKEAQLTGVARGIAIAAEGEVAYPVILTTQGQTLHNHHHHNVLKEGQLVLGDFGAETWRHYAGDITRTFPVSARFDARQRDIYQIVLDAEVQAIEQVKPGVPYRDIHLFAARIIAEGLKALGLMHCRQMPSPLRGAQVGFLDDLFVVPEARGKGVVEALYDELNALGNQHGWPFIRWITAEDNYRGRAVYDRLSDKTHWVTYQMAVK